MISGQPPTPTQPQASRSRPFGEQLPSVLTELPGPESRALGERLARVESGNVTDLRAPGPIFWAAARGSNVRDADGNVFLDLGGAFGVAAVGHARAEVVTALHEQAAELLHGMGDIHPSETKVRLLEMLAAWAPWPDTRSVLATSGSEAVEAALKTALLATGRPGIVAFEGSYHGLTLGSLAATHRDHFRAPFVDHIHDGVHFVPYPTTSGEANQVLASIESLLEEHPDIGCVIFEPIQGRGGVRVPPSGFLAALNELAGRKGCVLIADEIFTGFGRTGSIFASVEDGCLPDLICVGKAMGGGMPVSACMGNASVMAAWPQSTGEAIHTSTFLGHPGAGAAALAAVELLQKDALVERSATEGARWMANLKEALTPSPNVADVRGRGMMIGIELTEQGETAFGGGVGAVTDLLSLGLLLLPAGARGEVLELTPPLVITGEQIDFATGVLVDYLARRSGRLRPPRCPPGPFP